MKLVRYALAASLALAAMPAFAWESSASTSQTRWPFCSGTAWGKR